jgi:hypothetical protein
MKTINLVAVNKHSRHVIADDGQVFPITDLVDYWGDDTTDVELALAFIVKFSETQWATFSRDRLFSSLSKVH